MRIARLITHRITHRITLPTLVACGLVIGVPGWVSAQPSGKLTLTEALRLIDAAQADAATKNLRLSIAVVDARGDVVAVARMPDANPATADTAIGKAMLSAFFGQPSAAFTGRANTSVFQSLNAETGGRLRFFQGALPIVRNGFTVGAIGASGASAQQDEDSARAALASFK